MFSQRALSRAMQGREATHCQNHLADVVAGVAADVAELWGL